MTASQQIGPEALAPYGVGEPDAEGWYPDYRGVPAHLLPDAPQAKAAPKPGTNEKTVTVDGSWYAILSHWRLVVADLRKECGIDLHDPAVLAGSWLSVRDAIFSLLDSNTRLRAVLTRR